MRQPNHSRDKWTEVFAMGRTHGGARFYENGVFRGKRAMLSLTTGGPRDAYVKGGFNGDMFAILRPLHRGMLRFVGFDVLAPHIAYAPAHLSDAQRVELLENYTGRLRSIESEKPIEIGDYSHSTTQAPKVFH